MSGFNINKVTISGNLTRDPDLRSLPSGTSVCSLRLAVNGRKKVDGAWVDDPNFFDVTVWGRLGEICAERLSKGSQFGCGGRLDWREWETKDGGKRQNVQVVADELMLPDGDGSGGGGGSAQSDVPADTSGAPPSGGLPGADDDIPF